MFIEYVANVTEQTRRWFLLLHEVHVQAVSKMKSLNRMKIEENFDLRCISWSHNEQLNLVCELQVLLVHVGDD